MWKKLKNGSKIGLIAPSSPFEKKDLNHALNWFKKYGFDPVFGQSIFMKDRFLAGSDDARALDIMTFFEDASIDAIFCVRGGYGSPRLLNLLDYKVIKNNPKPVIGFSDNTALQWAIYTKTSVPSISGLTLIADFKTDVLAKNTENSLFKALHLEDYSVTGGQTIIEGKAEGQIACGCLSMIVSLMGTPFFPDLKNKILIIEDVGEEPYRIDRMLNQLKLADSFSKISALIIGKFKNCIAKDKNDGTIKEVISDNLKDIKKPVLIDFPYSHHDNRYVLPMGINAFLDTKEKTLKIIF
ncbi:MAG: LD-carboxypeptidase [Alphaproteobacteria bacterium]